MRALSWASGLALLLLWLVEAQSPPFYYHSWLYATPWRPLVPVHRQELDAQQLSLGYTGPQTFPLEAGQAQAQTTVRRPILLGVQLRPAAQQFTVPFRPSPFAGYSNDVEQVEQREQLEQRQQQVVQLEQLNQQAEPPFYAPGYPQAAAVVASPLIGVDQAEQRPPHYLYMAPSHQYNLVRS
ncbi:PREDICTED: uncharacterized protein LOC108618003 [Drosophila arizonae]|uniref:Uncharacterized protein LOC108618003 n=1 Tax=Drosophila arizonae TaxID=7263 RepID=A0ABM1PQB0_DROAR|nr:PREDICTED: uncharacterized protein LOC108618003 [Drosophila arizonae]